MNLVNSRNDYRDDSTINIVIIIIIITIIIIIIINYLDLTKFRQTEANNNCSQRVNTMPSICCCMTDTGCKFHTESKLNW